MEGSGSWGSHIKKNNTNRKMVKKIKIKIKKIKKIKIISKGKGQRPAWNEEELGKEVRESFEEFGTGKCREGKSWRRRKGSARKGGSRGVFSKERRKGLIGWERKRSPKKKGKQRTKTGETVSESEGFGKKTNKKQRTKRWEVGKGGFFFKKNGEFLIFGVGCTRQEKREDNREERRISINPLTSGKRELTDLRRRKEVFSGMVYVSLTFISIYEFCWL